MHPTSAIKLSDPQIVSNPFPHLERLREQGPVVYSTSNDVWMILGFDLARACLVDPEQFVIEPDLFLDMFGGHTLTSLRKPLHTAVRSTWQYEFQRAALERRQGLIESTVDDLLDSLDERLRDGQVVDLVPALTRRIPAAVISEMLGLPAEDRERFRMWIDDLLGMFNAITEVDAARAAQLNARGRAAQAELSAYCGELLQQRRESSGPNDLTRMLTESPFADPECRLHDPQGPLAGKTHMGESDLRAQIAQLVLAGQDNTANMMSHAIAALAQHPDQREALVRNRELLAQAVEEALRWQGALQVLPRTVMSDDVELAGEPLAKGSEVWLMLTAANRDPARWEKPGQFDIFRERKQNLAFGVGMHNCIGMGLARLEIQVLIDRLLDRFPNYDLAADEIDYGRNFITRAPQALPVALP